MIVINYVTAPIALALIIRDWNNGYENGGPQPFGVLPRIFLKWKVISDHKIGNVAGEYG